MSGASVAEVNALATTLAAADPTVRELVAAARALPESR